MFVSLPISDFLSASFFSTGSTTMHYGTFQKPVILVYNNIQQQEMDSLSSSLPTRVIQMKTLKVHATVGTESH